MLFQMAPGNLIPFLEKLVQIKMKGNDSWIDESYVTFFNQLIAKFQNVHFLHNPTNQDLKNFMGSFIKTGVLD